MHVPCKFGSESEHLYPYVRKRDESGMTALHCAAWSGDITSVTTIASCYSESELPQAICLQDKEGKTVLHYAATSAGVNGELAQCILTLLPESQRLHAVNIRDGYRCTVLHYVARSPKPDSMRHMLNLLPESQRTHTVVSLGEDGFDRTVLHTAVQSGNTECIQAILSLYPEPERLQMLDNTVGSPSDSIMEQHRSTSLDSGTRELDVEQPEAKRKRANHSRSRRAYHINQ